MGILDIFCPPKSPRWQANSAQRRKRITNRMRVFVYMKTAARLKKDDLDHL